MNNFAAQLLLVTLLLTSCRAMTATPASPLPTVVASGRSALHSPLPMPLPPVTATTSSATCTTDAEEPGAVAALQAELQLTEAIFFQWYCAGAGLGDIRKAYAVQAESGQPIETIFEQFFAGVGWGEISRPAVQTEVTAEEQLCLEEHSNHREVLKIAEEAGQPTELIAALFCKEMGFGEIRQAIAIHEETEEPIGKIADLFLESRDWAAIRAHLGAAPLQGDQSGND